MNVEQESTPIDEVVIVGTTGNWTGHEGYSRWLKLNGIDRYDHRLQTLAIRLTNTPDPFNPALRARVYVLPRSVHDDLIGEVEVALEDPDQF